MAVEEAVIVEDAVIIVTGLPRAGTSMAMRMLAAGGIPVLADGVRAADEDNPHGYFEFEPVKRFLEDSAWLGNARGKAVKIVAPLLAALPPGIPCRVILMERNLDEVLDSEARLIARRQGSVDDSPQRRALLKAEYARLIGRIKTLLSHRRQTRLLAVDRNAVLADPPGAARRIAAFLDGKADAERMAAAVDVALNRGPGDR